MEPVEPLVAVGNNGVLERRAVKEDEPQVDDGVHLLDLSAYLTVVGQGPIVVPNTGVLCTPAPEEGILLRGVNGAVPDGRRNALSMTCVPTSLNTML